MWLRGSSDRGEEGKIGNLSGEGSCLRVRPFFVGLSRFFIGSNLFLDTKPGGMNQEDLSAIMKGNEEGAGTHLCIRG